MRFSLFSVMVNRKKYGIIFCFKRVYNFIGEIRYVFRKLLEDVMR